MKFLRHLWNRLRYRELYKELKEAQVELAEFQVLLNSQRGKLKKEIALFDKVAESKANQTKDRGKV